MDPFNWSVSPFTRLGKPGWRWWRISNTFWDDFSYSKTLQHLYLISVLLKEGKVTTKRVEGVTTLRWDPTLFAPALEIQCWIIRRICMQARRGRLLGTDLERLLEFFHRFPELWRMEVSENGGRWPSFDSFGRWFHQSHLAFYESFELLELDWRRSRG